MTELNSYWHKRKCANANLLHQLFITMYNGNSKDSTAYKLQSQGSYNRLHKIQCLHKFSELIYEMTYL